jgi:hypothetical protein
MTLRAWNVWCDPAGTMQAWIGNAGMIVREGSAGEVVLCCSDGFGEASVDDLVVTLVFQERR